MRELREVRELGEVRELREVRELGEMRELREVQLPVCNNASLFWV